MSKDRIVTDNNWPEAGTPWRKSSRSYGTGDCVDVQYVNQMCDGHYCHVIVEDSSHPYKPRVVVSSDAWHQFLANIKNGYQPGT